MNCISFNTVIKVIIIGSLFSLFNITGKASQYEPPKNKVIDEFGVNLATAQVSQSLETVTIGGQLGLSHSLQSHTNSFSIVGYRGFLDKYTGKAQYVRLAKGVRFDGSSQNANSSIYVMRLSGPEGVADFKVLLNGVVQEWVPNRTSGNYSYEPLGDTRQSLVVSSDRLHLIWTLVDGTVVRYRRDAYDYARSSGFLADITYPNGFKITRHSQISVTSNTGFQLKYDYIDDNRSLDTDKLGSTFLHPLANSMQWSETNPKYIHAINNAVEYCSRTLEGSCQLSQSWPKATFTWPGGMPRALFIDDSIFSVTDADGRVTEYHFEGQDLAPKDPANPDVLIPGLTLGQYSTPRLVGVKPSYSEDIIYKYKYKNQFTRVSLGTNILFGNIFAWWQYTKLGEIVSASRQDRSVNYQINKEAFGPQGPLRNSTSRMEVINVLNFAGTLYRTGGIGKHDTILYENGYRNFVKRVTPKMTGPRQDYYYDTRGNVDYVILNKDRVDETTLDASYPLTCNNQKVCNKPTWTKDAKGNQTDYTYHAQSGQISSVTEPENEKNIRPQIRFTYAQKYATYKINGNTAEQSLDGIWLKATESYCVNSSYNGSSCAGNDEVVTHFEYEPSNLFLVGVAMTAQGETQRTCYRYDVYGNQIGETKPKAGLTSCIY